MQSDSINAVRNVRANLDGEHWIALLGKKDEPVDGLEDYCTFLGGALAKRGIELEKVRVNWVELGRTGALRQLSRECSGWRGKWVLLQYAALAWSRRGFPFYALLVAYTLQRHGARCVIVYHEPWGVSSARKWIGRVRRASQDWVVRALHRIASKSVFADPLETVAWVAKDDPKAAFIPIGGNIPEPSRSAEIHRNGCRSVGVFCLSEPPHLHHELNDIAIAAGRAANGGPKIRLVFMGRGTATAAAEIARMFCNVPVEISNRGLLSAEEVSQALAECDAMLCVRGRIYPRRGSAIAGIVCGLPIVGYGGEAEGTPLEDAGLALAPYRDAQALGRELARVLHDPALATQLRQKSQMAQRKHFSWDVIADSFIDFLNAPSKSA